MTISKSSVDASHPPEAATSERSTTGWEAVYRRPPTGLSRVFAQPDNPPQTPADPWGRGWSV